MTLLDAERRKCRVPRGVAGGAPEPARRLGPRRGAAARARSVSRSPRRWRRPPSRRSRACRSSAKAAPSCSGSDRIGRAGAGARSPRPIGGAPRERAARVPAPAQDRADAARLSPARRGGQEAPARLSFGAWPQRGRRPPPSASLGGARSRLRNREPEGRRRQDDDRRQPRRLSRRGGRALPARRSRPQANATSGLGMRANGVSTHDLLDGVPLSQLAKPTAFANLDLVPAKPELAAAAVQLSLRSTAASATSPTRSSRATDAVLVRLPRLPAGLRAADRQRARRRRPRDRPGPGRVLRARGPVAAARLDQPRQGPAQPRLAVAGILLTMVDGRTRLAAEVENELRRHFGDARLHHVRAALGAPRRGAEPRAARNRLRPPLVRLAGLLEGGDGTCRASIGHAPPRPRPRPRGADRRSRRSPSCCTCPSRRSTRTPASRAAASSPRRPRASPPRSATRACCSRSSSARGPKAATS